MKTMVRLRPPAYRFPLAMPGNGSWINLYEVEIYDRETEIIVVMRNHPDDHATSITNNVEHVATEVQKFLRDFDSKPIRWLEHYPKGTLGETWDEVTFDSGPPYRHPHWQHVEGFYFDWDSEVSPDYAEREYIQVIPQDRISKETYWFSPGECHRMATGCCSLDPSTKPEDGTGEDSYSYCREIARYALLWHHLVKYYDSNGGIPTKLDPWDIPTEVLNHARNFKSSFGGIHDVESDVRTAWRLFSPNSSDGLQGLEDSNGTISFSDGHHRTCIHQKLNLPLYGRLTVREPR